MKTIPGFSLILVACFAFAAAGRAAPLPHSAGSFKHLEKSGRSIVVTADTGSRLRLTPYGNAMLRVQLAAPVIAFKPDTWLPFIERHELGGELTVTETPAELVIRTASGEITLRLEKSNLAARWYCNGSREPQLIETAPATWSETRAALTYAVDPSEHFAGMGHGLYGRDAAPLDLRGRTVARAYGYQASLVVPWFISSKGYGLFLNCAFPHQFRFGVAGNFDVTVEGVDLGAALDYVLVAGTTPLELIDRFTQLTGRPRLQRKGMFGLQLSDKPHEAESRAEGAAWWYRKFPPLREAGFPTDAIVMDNTWRAGGGTWESSIFAFDREKYPDPKAFRTWAETRGLMLDVDFNGTMYVQSAGWRPEYGIRAGKFRGDQWFYLPNYFDPKVTDWFWSLVWGNVLNPALDYPNDMLWLDETDQANVPDERAPFWDGRPWLELKNLYILAGAKAVVSDWDRDFHGTKRPYVWFRSSAPGLQRYATYWTGDTDGNEADQSAQVAAMLAAGISGQPYFNHDAGGYQSIDEPIYRRYGIVTGSLTPIWRIHGPRGPRWPTEYPTGVQTLAHKYADLRYRLFPYIYSLARQSTIDGAPMVRAMFLDYPQSAQAWSRDYQYLFGPALLVAPPVASRQDVWLPAGRWYNWWTGESVSGGRTVSAPAGDDAAIYVRAGAVVPTGDFALSSAFIPKDRMEIHVWVGANGQFDVYEDDGVTEQYRDGAYSLTGLRWDDTARTLQIMPSVHPWSGAPAERSWTAVIHGVEPDFQVTIDGHPALGAQWDKFHRALRVLVPRCPAGQPVTIRLVPSGTKQRFD